MLRVGPTTKAFTTAWRTPSPWHGPGTLPGYPHDYADTIGKGHRRIASRGGETTSNPVPVATDREGRDLASLVWVESEHRGSDRVMTDIRCFISSLPPKARPVLRAVRQYWSIENAHHWVMDVALGEDDSRIRTGYAAHNRAILKCIAHKRLAAAWNKDCLCQLIGLKSKPI